MRTTAPVREHARTPARLAALSLLGVLAVSGCSEDPRPSKTGGSASASASGPSSQAAGSDTVRAAADKVLAFTATKPVASQTGTIKTSDDHEVSATADVVGLTRGKGSTVLLLRVMAQQDVDTDGGIFSNDEVGQSIDGVSVTVGDQKFYPGTYRYGEAVLAKNCTCTELIRQLGPDGVWMSADFAPLPEGTTQATLSIPGFTASSVPVAVKK
jgi:hypothetical protein